ncbi:glycosyltransferase [Aliiglaciecola sp. M165]|nr:glycosyltransferase [Aliiglaciecola sp. M165]
MSVHALDRLSWLQDAVESIVNQTYQNLVFAIVIDGPVSKEISDYLFRLPTSQKNVIVFEREYNCGLSSCMNFLIEYFIECDFKYFFRMDSDDISELRRIKYQVDFLQKNLDISVLGSSLIEINELGEKVGKRILPLKHREIVRFLPKRCSLNHPTVALRFEIFKMGFRYKEHLKNTQDYFFWIELAASGIKFANSKEKLLKFRRVNDFYKRRGFSKSLNEFKARIYAMKVLNKMNLSNIVYALCVLILRLMPSKFVKLAYKVDRYMLNKRVRHE